MSDFKFSCPSCGLHVVCDTSNAGMQIPCPGCQTMLTVPQAPAPAAPAVPTPGKLSINKSAHQSHAAPPPGASNAPAKPAWGTRPQPAPPPKKKFPIVPVLSIVGVLVALAIGWFAFLSPYLEKQAKEKQAAIDAKNAADAKAAAEAAAAAQAKKAVWKLDLSEAKFPDRVASGKHKGTPFTVETALFQSGSLTLRQISGSPRQFIVSLPLKTGESAAEKTFDVASDSTNTGLPRIMLNWKDDTAKVPGVESFAKGYALKLQFGAVADGKLPGKIYLCVPDAEQSYVAGNFEILPKTPATMQPVAAPANDPRAARRRKQ